MRTSSDGTSPTMSGRVAETLRDEILHGRMLPGERIRQEEIAARLGASRVPVREALRILEADGLVTLVANTGAWVAQLSLDECEEIYQIRERVEPLLLRYAAPQLREEDLQALEDLCVQMEASSDLEEFLRLDRDFHLLTYSTAVTGILGDLVDRLWNTTQHYRRAFTISLDSASRRVVHDEHHMITSALREHDIAGAERVLEGHIRRTRRRLMQHPEAFQTGTQ
jgi:DNA-binding GntR family transcriptional regulator